MAKDEISGEDLKPLAQIDRVIHEPARLLILAYLSVVESADFLFLMNQTALTRGNLSSHLSKLETAGYIEIKKEFVASSKPPATLKSKRNSWKRSPERFCASPKRAERHFRNTNPI
jgi:DNA-binding transcriptional ArsR family regulator